MAALTALAVSLCRRWTAIYTCGMPLELRTARRVEIESDLWEFQADAQDTGYIAGSIVLRLLLGLPHDLLWRLELTDRGTRKRQSVAAVAGAAALLVLTVLWIGFSLLNPELPRPAPSRSFTSVPHRRPPPPPPPPPRSYPKQRAVAGRAPTEGIYR